MTESPSPDLRIGDTERDEALRVLGEHLTVGRLTAEEYGQRAAQITTARTRGDVTRLFTDLPQPHPCLDPPLPVVRPPSERSRVAERSGSDRSAVQRFLPVLVPLSGIVALALFFGAGLSWLVFLLPVAMGMLVGAVTGEGRRRDR